MTARVQGVLKSSFCCASDSGTLASSAVSSRSGMGTSSLLFATERMRPAEGRDVGGVGP